MKRVLFFIFAFSSLCVQAQDADSKYAKDLLPAGCMAPELSGETKAAVRLENYRGRYVVLDFWATWCRDCRKDLPEMKALYEEFHPKGIEFIGVSFDTDKEVLDKFLGEKEIGWQQFCEYKAWKETEVSKIYRIQWIPTMYLIDGEGKVVLATVQIEKLRAALEMIGRGGNG